MKNNSLSFLAMVLLTVIFSSCAKKVDLGSEGSGQILLQFENAELGLKSATDEISAVFISIKDANSEFVYNMQRIDLIKVDGGYLTQNIEFEVGDYTLEDFVVVDSANAAIYLCPKAGSEFASYVDTPLPLVFTVSPKATTKVEVQVIPANLGEASKFGYAVFTFDILDVNDGLVAHYPLNNNFDDISGNQLHGINHGVKFGEDLYQSFNSAAYFDSLHYFSVPHNEKLNFGEGDFSVSAWIKTDSYSCQMILQKGGYNLQYDAQYWLRLYDHEGDVVFLSGNGNPPSAITSCDTVFLGTDKWHHIVGVREGEKQYLYIDSKLASEITYEIQNVDNDQDLKFGIQITNEGDLNPYSGYMDEIRIYNKALTQGEVDLLFERF